MINSFSTMAQALEKNQKFCPWVKQQSLDSYKDEIVSEAQEVVKAVNNKDYENLKEEIGDLLWDTMVLAYIGQEKGHFTVKQIIDGIVNKMRNRKPFIFEERTVTIDEANQIWRESKSKEKKK
jgi:uncharacterized protein YabN with tetrapyrrole methylase and pyrophosphatase domain